MMNGRITNNSLGFSLGLETRKSMEFGFASLRPSNGLNFGAKSDSSFGKMTT